MGFSKQEYGSGLSCPPPGDLPNTGIKPVYFMSPALGGRFFTTGATWEALFSQPQSTAVGSWRKIHSMPLFVFLKVKEFSFYSGETGWGGTTFPPLLSLLPQLKGWCNQTQCFEWLIWWQSPEKGDEGKEQLRLGGPSGGCCNRRVRSDRHDWRSGSDEGAEAGEQHWHSWEAHWILGAGRGEARGLQTVQSATVNFANKGRLV